MHSIDRFRELKRELVVIISSTLCDPHSIDAAKVEGKIVLCQRGPPPPLLDDFPQVPGAAGTIVIDNNKRGDNFLMTAFMDQAHLLISEKDGQALQSNIRDSKYRGTLDFLSSLPYTSS